jgi:hypothetical protein
MDWFRSDQSANTVAANEATRRGKFIAAISTGRTEPVSHRMFAETGKYNVDLHAANFEVGRKPRPRKQIIIKDKRQALLHSYALIRALEEAIGFNPARHGNRSPPELRSELDLDNAQSRSDITELIAELKKLNAFLETSGKPRSDNKKDIIRLKKHLNSFLQNYAKTVGTGAGYLTLGAVANLLISLGGGEVVALAMAFKAIKLAK